jgi:poly-gamma-glutamate synthesis protein (capsule biosynthesis protein)
MLAILAIAGAICWEPQVRTRGAGYAVYLPVVAFGSLQTSLPLERLSRVRAGTLDSHLVIAPDVLSDLANLGINIAPGTLQVPRDKLTDWLWKHPDAFTLLPLDALTPRLRVLHVDDVHPLDMDLATYPFAVASSTPNYQPDRLTRIIMTGTTAIVNKTADAIRTQGIAWAGDGLRPYFSHADFVHMSNEVSFAPQCQAAGVYGIGDYGEKALGRFCTPLSMFDLLPYLGVNIVEQTGNHNLDYNRTAYLKTLELYHQHNIVTIGGGATLHDARQPDRIDHHGNRIALLACNWAGPGFALAADDRPGAAFCDRDWLKATLPVLARQYDVLIVSVQYQEFDLFRPPGTQMVDFRDLSDWGASVVIGTQAHTPQTFEFHPAQWGGDTFIHYGVGNLYFDQTGFQQDFILDQLFIYQNKLITVDLFPGRIANWGRPQLLEEPDRTFFLRVILSQSF